MCTYFKAKTDVAKNLIDNFFTNWRCHLSIGKILSEKKLEDTGSISEKIKGLYLELFFFRSFSVPGDFLQYIYLFCACC